MQYFRISNNKGKRNSFALYSVLFLLMLYLVGTVEIGSFHAILHNTQDESKLHSKVNETNACHQSVYHNQKGKNCEHKSHVVANKKCAMCQLSHQSFHFASAKPADYLTISVKGHGGEVQPLVTAEEFSLLPSRAPPLLS
ncbi:MAG TPA: hypothetical protein DIS90_04125 [Cytophagales bacterium]|nr:hypothetical protein [Cytophagales bacterium]